MKLAVSSILVLMVLCSAALADSPDPSVTAAFSSKGVSSSCENKILKSVTERCNSDSLKAEGKDRMNPCGWTQADISSGGQYSGELEVGMSAGDADDYWYAISVENPGSCEFRLTAEQ